MGSEITGKVKLPPLGQIGVVVKDIDKVIEYYMSTFSIGPWEIKEGEYRELKVRDQVYSCKTRVARASLGPVELELFEVREGRSLHSEFLDKGREGVHHLGFMVSKEEKELIIAELAEIGIGVVQGARLKSGGSYAFLDTERPGGIFFELIEKLPE